ncbi:YkvA family protein [Egbenema bharatensis]|uniref:YkvA family protein n=1 Tax=Egbenema bharatensis TaxID=3463334 RepID=UPI003A85E1EA
MNNPVQSLYNWYRSTLRNPKYRWWLILGTALYVISPIDIAPDFIPIIGQIDDVVIVTLLVSEVSQLLIDRIKAKQDRSVVATADGVRTADTVDINAVEID